MSPGRWRHPNRCQLDPKLFRREIADRIHRRHDRCGHPVTWHQLDYGVRSGDGNAGSGRIREALTMGGISRLLL
jgi:hypothetical protein